MSSNLETLGLNVLARFCDPATRSQAGREIAQYLGGTDLLLFAYDEAVGVFLPARGFPQSLPDGLAWAKFLCAAAETNGISRLLLNPFTGEVAQAFGIKASESICFVLLGSERPEVPVDALKDLATILSFGVRGEVLMQNAAAMAEHASESEKKARALTLQLDETRRELQASNRQLSVANDDLEKRVATRTVELTEAYHQMEAFNYSIAHDIRVPIREIVVNSRLLKLDYPETAVGSISQELSSLERSALKLARLVEDLLAFARLGREEVRKSELDLTQMVRYSIRVHMEHNGRACTAEVDESVMGRGDATLIRTVIDNLVDNAFKYAKPGEDVKIRFRALHPNTYSFEDGGIGFESPYKETIFKVFERLHQDDHIKGTGIGLANVRRIIEKHGGSIHAESIPGEGSAFIFTLP